MAFHIAGFMCFKEAMAKAAIVHGEPIMKVEVTMLRGVHETLSAMLTRRGRIEGMDDLGGGKIVHAYVPLAEMFVTSTDLRSKTQGRETTQCSSTDMSWFQRMYRTSCLLITQNNCRLVNNL